MELLGNGYRVYVDNFVVYKVRFTSPTFVKTTQLPVVQEGKTGNDEMIGTHS